MSLLWGCIIHHSAYVSELIPGRRDDVAPVVAEQRAAEWHLVNHKLPLEGDGGHIIQQGGHVWVGKESFDGRIDAVAGGFFLLVEDAQKGLEEIGGCFDGWSFRWSFRWSYRWCYRWCYRWWFFRGKRQQIVNIHLEG